MILFHLNILKRHIYYQISLGFQIIHIPNEIYNRLNINGNMHLHLILKLFQCNFLLLEGVFVLDLHYLDYQDIQI